MIIKSLPSKREKHLHNPDTLEYMLCTAMKKVIFCMLDAHNFIFKQLHANRINNSMTLAVFYLFSAYRNSIQNLYYLFYLLRNVLFRDYSIVINFRSVTLDLLLSPIFCQPLFKQFQYKSKNA